MSTSPGPPPPRVPTVRTPTEPIEDSSLTIDSPLYPGSALYSVVRGRQPHRRRSYASPVSAFTAGLRAAFYASVGSMVLAAVLSALRVRH
jgi:hypothetical protein